METLRAKTTPQLKYRRGVEFERSFGIVTSKLLVETDGIGGVPCSLKFRSRSIVEEFLYSQSIHIYL